MLRCKGGTGRKGDWHKGGERKPASAKGGCGPLYTLQKGDKKAGGTGCFIPRPACCIVPTGPSARKGAGQTQRSLAR